MLELTAFLRGMVAGLILTVYIGATFFLLIETSITQGARRALRMNIGVWLSDLLVIGILLLSGPEVFRQISNQHWIQSILVIAFFCMGIFFIASSFRKKASPARNRPLPTSHLLFKGWLINTLNPSVLIFWLGTIALLFNRFKYSFDQCLIFFAGMFITVITFDILKIYYASRLKHYVPGSIIPWLNAIAGVLIVFFSIKFALTL